MNRLIELSWPTDFGRQQSRVTVDRPFSGGSAGWRKRTERPRPTLLERRVKAFAVYSGHSSAATVASVVVSLPESVYALRMLYRAQDWPSVIAAIAANPLLGKAAISAAPLLRDAFGAQTFELSVDSDPGETAPVLRAKLVLPEDFDALAAIRQFDARWSTYENRDLANVLHVNYTYA